jgi:hypothetical protein
VVAIAPSCRRRRVVDNAISGCFRTQVDPDIERKVPSPSKFTLPNSSRTPPARQELPARARPSRRSSRTSRCKTSKGAARIGEQGADTRHPRRASGTERFCEIRPNVRTPIGSARPLTPWLVAACRVHAGDRQPMRPSSKDEGCFDTSLLSDVGPVFAQPDRTRTSNLPDPNATVG